MIRDEIVTRAVIEKDPSILLESGYSLSTIASHIYNESCLLNMSISNIFCMGLRCSGDDCPFSSSNGNTQDIARKWIMAGEKRDSILPEPAVTNIADKNKHFKESNNLSLTNLISNFT